MPKLDAELADWSPSRSAPADYAGEGGVHDDALAAACAHLVAVKR